jgi:3-oxoacyl-[acyl-carrier-protein] synthase II
MRDGRRVAVTGIGIVSCAGLGGPAFWDAALAGRSSLGIMQALADVRLPGRVVGEVQGVDLTECFANKKLLRMVSRRTFMCVTAAEMMMQDARIEPGSVAPEDFGIYLGDYGTFEDDIKGLVAAMKRAGDDACGLDLHKFGSLGIKALNPLMLLINIPNAPTAHISMQRTLRGLGNTFLTDFIASTQAIGEAAAAIRDGGARCMVAGGLGILNPLSLLEFRAFGLTAEADEEPARAVRPFDATAGGFAPAEGAVFLLLEDLETAARRGAPLYAEVAGYASAYEPSPDDVVPDSEGRAVSRALEAALDQAGLAKGPDCVVASGLGHAAFDRAEGRALRRLHAQAPGVDVTAITPIAGHLQGGMGALQAAAAALVLQTGAIPPIANHETPPGELSDLPFVHGGPLRKRSDSVAISALGMRGQAAALVFKRAEIVH